MRRTLLLVPLVLAIFFFGYFLLPAPKKELPRETNPPTQGTPPSPTNPAGTAPEDPRPPEVPTAPDLPPTKTEAPKGSLIVLVRTSGLPVLDAQIDLLRHQQEHSTPHPKKRTGTDGRADFPDLADGEYEILIRHENFIPQQRLLQIAGGRSETINVELLPGVTLVGTVREKSGAPIAETQVSVLDSETLIPIHPSLGTLSDLAGNYRVTGLPTGLVAVNAHHHRFKPALKKGVLLESPGREIRLDLVLEPGSFIAGLVRSSTGLPIAGAAVGASNETASVTRTDAQGRFMIFGLGEEPVNLFARAKGYGAAYLRHQKPNTSNIEFVLFEAGSIAGRVVADKPLPGFSVLVYHFEEDLQKELLIITKHFDAASNGAFFLPEVPAGLYELSVEAEGYPHADRVRVSVGISQPVTGVVLTLKKQ